MENVMRLNLGIARLQAKVKKVVASADVHQDQFVSRMVKNVLPRRPILQLQHQLLERQHQLLLPAVVLIIRMARLVIVLLVVLRIVRLI